MKILCSLLCLTIAFGCGPTFAADQGKATQTAKTDKTDKTAKAAKTATAKVPKETAQATALKLVPGELLCWDLEIESGVPQYAFYVRGKDGRISEVEMDGNTGEKTNIGILIDSQSSDGRRIKTTNAADRARLKLAKLTIEQSQEKALKAYPGSVEAWEILVWESGKEGKLIHDFRIVGKSGKKVVTIDSKTGELMSICTFVDGQGR